MHGECPATLGGAFSVRRGEVVVPRTGVRGIVRAVDCNASISAISEEALAREVSDRGSAGGHCPAGPLDTPEMQLCWVRIPVPQ